MTNPPYSTRKGATPTGASPTGAPPSDTSPAGASPSGTSSNWREVPQRPARALRQREEIVQEAHGQFAKNPFAPLAARAAHTTSTAKATRNERLVAREVITFGSTEGNTQLSPHVSNEFSARTVDN